MTTDKSLFARVLDTAIITGVSVIVASTIGSAVAFMWSKAINFDAALVEATKEIRATQEVYGRAIDANTKAIQEFKNIVSPTPKIAPSAKMALPEIQQEPIQEALQNYRTK